MVHPSCILLILSFAWFLDFIQMEPYRMDSFHSNFCNLALCLWDSSMRLCLSQFILCSCSIPLYKYATVCLPITVKDEHTTFFQFGARYEYSLYKHYYTLSFDGNIKHVDCIARVELLSRRSFIWDFSWEKWNLILRIILHSKLGRVYFSMSWEIVLIEVWKPFAWSFGETISPRYQCHFEPDFRSVCFL